MARLSDLFVSIRADDSAARKVLSGFRKQLDDTDRKKVSPKITVPEKAQADLAGLQTKLAALGRTQVKLNVDSATIKADVATLERQLATLKAKKTSLPVDLQDTAEKEIREVEAALAKAQRKQTQIPLKLERVEAQIAAVEGELGKAGKRFQAAGSNAGKAFGGAFGGAVKSLIAGAVAYVGVSEVVGFFKDANAEAREAQKVGAVTTQVIKATGGAARISADQVGQLATAISNKTGMDDEAIQTGANLLLTFKQVRNEAGAGRDVFNQATQAAADLSAAGFGSVESASKLLGKALNDPVKGMSALTRAGVTFTDEQKKINKALIQGGDINALVALGVIDSATEFNIQLKRNGGDVRKTVGLLTADLSVAQKKQYEYYTEGGHFVEAQKTILTEVQQQVGGVAAASATAGEKAKVAFGNLKEQIGTALLPAVDAVATAMSGKVIPAISAFISGMQSGTGPGGKFADIMKSVGSALSAVGKFLYDNRTLIGGLVTVIGTIAAATKVWAAAQLILNVALTANPIGLIVVAIGGLVAGLIYAYKHSEKFRDIVNTVGAVLKGTFLAAVEGVKTAVGAVAGAFVAVRDKTIEVWTTVKNTVVGVWQAIVGFFTSAGGAVVGAVSGVWEKVRAVTVTVLNAVGGVIKGILGGYVTILKVGFTAIAAIAILAWDGFKTVTSAAFTFVRDKIVAPVWAAVAKIFGTATKLITGVFTNFWNGLKTIAITSFLFYRDKIITPVWNKVASIFATVQETIRKAFDAWWSKVKTIANTAWTYVRDKIITPIWTKITSLFSSAQTAIRTAFDAWWGKLKSLASAAFGVIKTTVDAALGKVKGYFSAAQTAVKTAWDTFWGKIKSTAASALDTAKSKVDTVLGKIKGSFSAAKESIKKAWDGVKGVVSAPINYVKENVYNKPLVPIWNRVADLVNGPKLSAYARGGIAEAERYANGGTPFGVRPGYTPGRDTHTIMVGGGEAIMRPEWTRAVGAGFVNAANKAARSGGVSKVRDFMLNRSDPTRPNQEPVDAFAGGGVVGWIKDKVGGAWSGIKDLAGTLKDFALGGLKKAANAILGPLRGVIRDNLSGSGVRSTIGGIASKALDLVVSKIGKEDEKVAATGGGIGPIDVNNPRGRTTFRGGVFTNLFAANLRKAEQIGKVTIPAIQGGFRPQTSYSGTSHRGDAIDTTVNYAALRAMRAVGIATGDRTGLGNWAPHMHAVPLPGHGFGAGSAVWQAQDYLRRGGASQSPRSPWGLENGALVKGGRGGVAAAIGEGSYDELVTPVPSSWKPGATDDKLDRLIELFEQRQSLAVTVPLELNIAGDKRGQTINATLQRTADVSLV